MSRVTPIHHSDAHWLAAVIQQRVMDVHNRLKCASFVLNDSLLVQKAELEMSAACVIEKVTEDLNLIYTQLDLLSLKVRHTQEVANG